MKMTKAFGLVFYVLALFFALYLAGQFRAMSYGFDLRAVVSQLIFVFPILLFVFLLPVPNPFPAWRNCVVPAVLAFLLVVGICEAVFQVEEYSFRRHARQQDSAPIFKDRFFPYDSCGLYFENGRFGAND